MAPVEKKHVHVLTLHGIGHPESSYSAKAMQWLGAALRKKGVELHYQAAWYDPILNEGSAEFLADQQQMGLDTHQLSTDLVWNTLSDATAYRHPAIQDRVFDVVDTAYARLRSDEVVVIGHSLGCLVAIDWLNSRTSARISNLVTLACNSKLWYLGHARDGKRVPFPTPAQARGGKWLNVLDKDDALAAFMSPYSPAVDLEVEVQGWFKRTGAAHTKYWTSSRLWEKTLVPFVLD